MKLPKGSKIDIHLESFVPDKVVNLFNFLLFLPPADFHSAFNQFFSSPYSRLGQLDEGEKE